MKTNYTSTGLVIFFLLILYSFSAKPQSIPTVPERFKVSEYASSNLLSNPVAISFDDFGRLYVAEAHRKNTGVWGVTFSRWWAMEDYQSSTLEEREAMYDRWSHIVSRQKMESKSELVRILLDEDLDGKADKSHIFADGFNNRLDGNAAGILALGDKVLLANIPHLWELRDQNQDNIAEIKNSLHKGFGVRVGVHGHDLHGLVQGPDGKIYFTVGDRGYDVINDQGIRFHESHKGAVFRCLPDGSKLEVFHTGLRNPQELAFNDQGDLFTVDNNMSGGDECRILHLLQDGDSAWDATFQLSGHFRGETNRKSHTRPTWFTERLWAPPNLDLPKWHNPAIGNLSRGPSGLAFYPGTGLSNDYKNKFFLADFVGNAANSYVLTFSLDQFGASYKFAQSEVFAKNVLATDIEFAPDGNLYIADWITGWSGTGQGKIWKVKALKDTSLSATISKILSDSLEKTDNKTLVHYLSNPDQRVRYKSQFELVKRDSLGSHSLIDCLSYSKNSIAKIHSLWGLGQLAEKRTLSESEINACLKCLDDASSEVRAQAAKIYRWIPRQANHDQFIKCLHDPNPRVLYQSIMSAYKLGLTECYELVLDLIAEQKIMDDHALRHAAVCFLSSAAKDYEVSALQNHASPDVREMAVLALRRMGSSKVLNFCNDPEKEIVYAVIRAAHDIDSVNGMKAIADMAHGTILSQSDLPFPIGQRIINANFRIGKEANAKALSSLVRDTKIPMSLRLSALESLRDWKSPSPFDRVTWHLKPHLTNRFLSVGKIIKSDIIQSFHHFSKNKENFSNDQQMRALLAIAHILIDHKIASKQIAEKIVINNQLPSELRLQFFDYLANRDNLPDNITRETTKDPNPKLSTRAHVYLANNKSQSNIAALKKQLHGDDPELIQTILDQLPENNTEWVTELITGASKRAINGDLPKDALLNVFQALVKRSSLAIELDKFTNSIIGDDRLGKSILSFDGGDEKVGQYIFNNHISQCVRCHRVNGFGGQAGPDLSRIGSTHSTREIVESIIWPNEKIASGFGITSLTLKDGRVISGTSEEENDSIIKLMTLDKKILEIKKADIETRNPAQSSMPPMGAILSLRELRDLVSYLKNLK